MHRYLKMRDMPKEILRTMGRRLRMLREETDMDQRQFAHAVSQRGVSVTNSFVSKMESGDSKPSIDVLVAIADELGVSADYLLMRTAIPDTAENMLAEIEKRQHDIDVGVGVSEAAATVANIIDDISDTRRRGEIVEVVRLLAEQSRRGLQPNAVPGTALGMTDSAEQWIGSVQKKAAAPKVSKRRSRG